MNDNKPLIATDHNESVAADRRRFVGNAMRLPLAFFVPAISADALANIEPASMSAEQRIAAMQRMLYLLFPLDQVSNGPYERATASLLDRLDSDPAQLTMVDQGFTALDQAAGGPWLTQAEEVQIAAMSALEQTPFFGFMYGNAQAAIFNDREVWAAIGYGGSALEFGGYNDHLVEDIEWIEEI